MSRTVAEEAPVRARIPADLDAPDRVAFGLTVRQAAVLAGAAVPLYLVWQQLAGQVPLPVLAAVTVPVAAAAAVVALGRRDGLPLDAWLLAALVHHRTPRRLVPTRKTVTPAWAPPHRAAPSPARSTGRGRAGRLGVLRLPASAIGEDGTLTTGSASVALVAATTVTSNLNTVTEQAAQVAAYARWLNALTGPVQIVVSARRLDLGARAEQAGVHARALTSPALATAAVDYAWFLLDLLETNDPLERTVTIACISPHGHGNTGGGDAARRAAATSDALTAVGVRCRVLDAAETTAVLTAASDPYTPTDATTPRTPPGAAVTGTDHLPDTAPTDDPGDHFDDLDDAVDDERDGALVGSRR